MYRGDKVYIDPKKIREEQPERMQECKDYFYKTYIIGFVLSNKYVTATPIGDNSYTQVILDLSVLSYV